MEFVIADEINGCSLTVNILEDTKDSQQKDIIDLLGRLEQDNPQYTADEMIAKVVTHQKALQTLLLSISRAVILLGNLSQTFAEISEESDQISAHYGLQHSGRVQQGWNFREYTAAADLATSASSRMGQDPV
jgi:hypothetical protein